MIKRKNYSDYKVSAVAADVARQMLKAEEALSQKLADGREGLNRSGKLQNTKDQAEAQKNIEILREELRGAPPAPLTEEEAKARLAGIMQKALEESEKEIVKFQKEALIDPVYAIEWMSEDVAKAAVNVGEYTTLLRELEKSTLAEFIEKMVEFEKEEQNRIMRTASFGSSSSTSQVKNAITNAKNQARAELWGQISLSGLTQVMWYLAEAEMAVKAWEEVNA